MRIQCMAMGVVRGRRASPPDCNDRSRSLARLALMQAVSTVLANGLTVLGVAAPERM